MIAPIKKTGDIPIKTAIFLYASHWAEKRPMVLTTIGMATGIVL
jgi:hypothetical protein